MGHVALKPCLKRSKVYLWASNYLGGDYRSCHFYPSSNFFFQKCLNNKLPTTDWIEGVSPLCPLCHASNETVDHMFYKCPFSTRVWDLFPSNIDNPTYHPTLTHWFLNCHSIHKAKLGVIVSWYIWKTCNNLIFKHHPPHPIQVKCKTIWHFLQWNLSRLYAGPGSHVGSSPDNWLPPPP